MPTDKEWLVKAIGKLRERGVHEDHCVRCGHDDWTGDRLGLAVVDLPQEAGGLRPTHIPVLVLTCKNCGYTVFHNQKVLDIEK